jgi:hypothetical protein
VRSEVVLIGPVGAGKSTVGAMLSSSLGVPHVDMDVVGDQYYEAAGFPLDELVRRMLSDFFAAYHWAKSSLPFALERVLQDHADCVFSLGAIHTHFDDATLFARAKAALAPFEHVVLLLPCADPDRSVEILRDRSTGQGRLSWVFDGYDFFHHWVHDSCNRELATLVVYTDEKTPQQVADEVASALAAS